MLHGSVNLLFVGAVLFCFYFADISITTHDPWLEIDRMIAGVFAPDFLATSAIGDALLKPSLLHLLELLWEQLRDSC